VDVFSSGFYKAWSFPGGVFPALGHFNHFFGGGAAPPPKKCLAPKALRETQMTGYVFAMQTTHDEDLKGKAAALQVRLDEMRGYL